jgi:hypothetical protein
MESVAVHFRLAKALGRTLVFPVGIYEANKLIFISLHFRSPAGPAANVN